MTNNFPNLFKKLNLGPVILNNRSVMSAHGMMLGDDSGVISPRQHEYLVKRAEGGAGLVSAASLPVHNTSQNFKGLQIRCSDEKLIPSLKKLSKEIKARGSFLSISLWHGGYNVSWLGGSHAIAPSQVPNSRGELPKEITSKEIEEIIKSYCDAAFLCVGAGVDVIELQTASDYLLGSFLSPILNRRKDDYGGNSDNRRRIIVEILESIKKNLSSVNNFSLGIRTSIEHNTPGATTDYCQKDSLETVSYLSHRGLIDFVSLTSGTYRSPVDTVPTMDRPRLELAEASKFFKNHLEIPVIVANRIRTPEEADNLISNGAADAVAMARTWIAEPEWAKKAITGNSDRIRPCISCNQACSGFLSKGIRASCIINPIAGREIEFQKILVKNDKTKRIAVVGAGPAGLEAARVSATIGYEVILFEKSPFLGGAFRIAALAPFRKESLLPINWWERELEKLKVDIKIKSTINSIDEIEADKIIWATGAIPSFTSVLQRRPYLTKGIKGSEGLPHGREVLSGQKKVSGNVVVVDEEGGWPAISILDKLISLNYVNKVTYITSDIVPGGESLNLTRESKNVQKRLNDNDVKIFTSSLVSEINKKNIIFEDGRSIESFESIVLSTGVKSLSVPSGVISIGDCVAPRNVWAATNDVLNIIKIL